MIGAIIADDEAWVRSLLRNIVDWKDLGIQLIGEAENGTSALRECITKQPDILVTDIKMPGIDGLELIRKLRQRLPDLITIIISGYDDFTFAQCAIRSAALDYVLKPINKKQLEAVLGNAVGMIREKKSKDEAFQLLNDKVKKLEASFTSGDLGGTFMEITDKRIGKACAFLNSHYAENPTLCQVADLCFMNRTYFSEIFKRETGMGFSQYLFGMKMEKACLFLDRTELKVCEIAGSLGYSDPGYFVRVFRKKFRLTPEEHRRQGKKVRQEPARHDPA